MNKVIKLFSLVFLFLILPESSHASGNLDSDEFLITFRGVSMTMVEVLSQYVQIKSESGNEKEAGEWLKELCQENGLYIHQMGSKDGNYNFSASIYPLSNRLPNIIFLNHIDIVPAKQIEKWTHNPYSGIVENNELWGRGSYDNKGNAIMQLFSILEFQKRNKGNTLPFNLTFLAVSCEESQTEGGVRYVVENYLDVLNVEAVIGEGASGMIDVIEAPISNPVFCISLNHKKALWLKLELETNTIGHGSVSPNEYANKEMNEALYRILNKKQKFVYNDLNIGLLKQMSSLYSGTKRTALKHPRLFKPFLTSKIRKQPELFALFSNTITLTSIESSSHIINSIPSKVTALLDCRLLPEQSAEEFLSEIKARLGNDKIKVNVIHSMPSMVTAEKENMYYRSMAQAIQEMYPGSHVFSTMLPNFNDVGVFRAKGIPAYGVIPVVLKKKYLESLHNVNERIPIEILNEGKSTYIKFVELLLQEQRLIVKE